MTLSVRFEPNIEYRRDVNITEPLTLIAIWRKRVEENLGNDAFTYRGEGKLSWLKVEVDADTFAEKDVQVHANRVETPDGFEEYATDSYEIYFTSNGERIEPTRLVRITLPHLRNPELFIGIYRETNDDKIKTEYLGRWAEHIEILDSVIVSTYVMAYVPEETDAPVTPPSQDVEDDNADEDVVPSDDVKTDGSTKPSDDLQEVPTTGEGVQVAMLFIVVGLVLTIVVRKRMANIEE